MKSIDLKELKLIQLDIVEALHEFCTEHGIKYSLACGSLLGAIRHNGYIPWDDDIDIYMEREDYNKFITLFPHNYRGIYDFVCIETDNEWNLAIGKLYDTRTVLIEHFDDWLPIGINIDVFPVDSVPDNKKTWENYNKLRRFFLSLILYKYITRKEKAFFRNFMRYIIKIPYLFFTRRMHSKFINWYAQLYNGRNHKGLFENVQGILQKQPFDKEDFAETILHKFEDREFCVMKGYDHCLKCGFGDYMKLPPIEKRISHHSFEAYWKD